MNKNNNRSLVAAPSTTNKDRSFHYSNPNVISFSRGNQNISESFSDRDFESGVYSRAIAKIVANAAPPEPRTRLAQKMVRSYVLSTSISVNKLAPPLKPRRNIRAKDVVHTLLKMEHDFEEVRLAQPDGPVYDTAIWTARLLYKLSKHAIETTKIVALADGGFALKFINEERSVLVDVYNDGEIAILSKYNNGDPLRVATSYTSTEIETATEYIIEQLQQHR